MTRKYTLKIEIEEGSWYASVLQSALDSYNLDGAVDSECVFVLGNLLRSGFSLDYVKEQYFEGAVKTIDDVIASDFQNGGNGKGISIL